MPLRNGYLQGLPLSPARAIGGSLSAEIVVVHDTAGPLDPGSAVDYLSTNDRNVSAHFVIERDGTVVQLVPLDRVAHHAGVSTYRGRKGCNQFSIGIELVNPGRMQAHNVAQARAWWGETFDIEAYGIQALTTQAHGYGLWMPYTEQQITAVNGLLKTLFDEVPTLSDVVAHWYVSPGRKTDTNPLFPLDELRARLFGREDPQDLEAEARSRSISSKEYVVINTPADTLNMRRWPSFNPNIIARIPHETIVPVIRQGSFDGREWLLVFYAGKEGWVTAHYTDPMTFQGVPR